MQLTLLAQHQEEFVHGSRVEALLSRTVHKARELEGRLQNRTARALKVAAKNAARVKKRLQNRTSNVSIVSAAMAEVARGAKRLEGGARGKLAERKKRSSTAPPQAQASADGPRMATLSPHARLALARSREAARLAKVADQDTVRQRLKGRKALGSGPGTAVDPGGVVPPLSEPDEHTTIVLEVSAFLDGSRCGRTIWLAFQRASNPARLRVNVLQARGHAGEEMPDCVAEFKDGHLRELCAEGAFQRHMVSPHEGVEPSAGLCEELVLQAVNAWVIPLAQGMGPVHQRGLANLLLRYEGEDDMCLSTDSHMGFLRNWDQLLISEWLSLRNEFAVLTVYPGSMTEMDKGLHEITKFPTFCGYVHEPSAMEPGMPRGCAAAAADRDPGEARLPLPTLTMNWAAGFSFHRCHAERAAPADYHLKWMFSGEEANRATRLWTHGYDLYVPVLPVVLHDYTSAKQLFWSYRDPAALKKSQKRLRLLLSMGGDTAGAEEPAAPYALGSQRTMEQFVNWSRQDLGEAWGPWLQNHGLKHEECGWNFCRTLTRLAVADEVALVASVGANPPERGTVRLSAFPSGRLEIFDGSRWGTVCGDPWAAGGDGPSAVCQQLGYDAGGSTAGARHAVPRPPVVGNRACRGGEATLFDCPLRDGVHSEFEGCHDSHDAWISCRNASTLPEQQPEEAIGCCQVSKQDNKCAAYEYAGDACCTAGESGCTRPRCDRGYWAEDAVYDSKTGACVRPVGHQPHGAQGATSRSRREPPRWCGRWDGSEAYPMPVH